MVIRIRSLSTLPKIICINELDKMPRTVQLLNFIESGRVKVDQQKKQYDFEIKGVKVFVRIISNIEQQKELLLENILAQK
jgi:hypothetical protein